MKLDDIEKVHPMRQIFWASIIQISVLALMGAIKKHLEYPFISFFSLFNKVSTIIILLSISLMIFLAFS